MLLHVIIAAALLAPGSAPRTAAVHTASVVCAMVAVEMKTASSARHSLAHDHHPVAATATVAYLPEPNRLTTQLRQ